MAGKKVQVRRLSKARRREMMECVAHRHAYEDVTGLNQWSFRIIQGELFLLRCYRCATEREIVINILDFTQMSNRYRHSPEYRFLLDELHEGRGELTLVQAGRKFFVAEVKARRKAA